MQVTFTTPLIAGEIADYYFEDGILYSLSKSVKRTVENISNNVTLIKKITGNKPVPLLIYLSKSPVPDKATRKFSSQMVPEIYTAMAMVSKPGLAQLVMRMVFAFQKPPIPMKSFSSDKEALLWLRHFVK
ncbi:MAG: STAS/SEC14 domain-containing protein [Chitinophagales bacterium]